MNYLWIIMQGMSLCGFIEKQCRGLYIETHFNLQGWLTEFDPEWQFSVAQYRRFKN